MSVPKQTSAVATTPPPEPSKRQLRLVEQGLQQTLLQNCAFILGVLVIGTATPLGRKILVPPYVKSKRGLFLDYALTVLAPTSAFVWWDYHRTIRDIEARRVWEQAQIQTREPQPVSSAGAAANEGGTEREDDGDPWA